MPPIKYPQLWDAEWLSAAYETRSARQVASELGCTEGQVFRSLQRQGIGRKRPQESYPALENAQWLTDQYHDKQRTAVEIATELGCSPAGVHKAMKRHGIALRASHESRLLRGTSGRQRIMELGDAEWVRSRYVDEGMSIPEIAKILGCQNMPVHRALVKHGIPRRKPGAIRAGKQRADATYQRGPNGESRSKHGGGYVLIQKPDHPAADFKGRVVEHRYIAEQKLGRPLKKGEVVHHINGIRDDNRPENLQVFPSNSAHRKHHQELERERKKD